VTSRRDLLRTGAALVATLPTTFPSLLEGAAQATLGDRSDDVYKTRLAAAAFERDQSSSAQRANGDEEALPRYVGMYSKALPHNDVGEVEPEAYAFLLRALRSGRPRDFDFIPRIGELKLANPQAGFGFTLVGPDSAALSCPPAPRFSSAQQAAEMIELYWQALARDVPFDEYDAHPLIARAAKELGRGPATLFRSSGAGSATGPYVSQFLLKDIFFAPLAIDQKFQTAPAGRDHVDGFDHWLDIQNGGRPHDLTLVSAPCYVRNGRDLAEYVHRDFTYQAALSAALILQRMGAPVNPGNPYAQSGGQSAFVTFGTPFLLYLIATATHAALMACWYQKWMVHRRLRPEEFGGRLSTHLAKRASYPFDSTLLESAALAETLRVRGSALLSQAYPEGSPAHPAYPAGHAVVSAAGTTILKAFFDESFIVPDPVVASEDGLSLRRFDRAPLKVGGELDKLAANIGMGRNFAGIHWRSDLEAGFRLGEDVAIRVLREMHIASHEPFSGLHFHRRDGTPVAV